MASLALDGKTSDGLQGKSGVPAAGRPAPFENHAKRVCLTQRRKKNKRANITPEEAHRRIRQIAVKRDGLFMLLWL